MPEGADPLGRRALFWAPAEREGSEPGRRSEPVGKRALFSDPSPLPHGVGDSVAGESLVSRLSGLVGLVEQIVYKLPLGHSNREPSDDERRSKPGGLRTITVRCGSCDATRRVDMFQYARLHLPVFFVRPGRGFTHFITCPACAKRAWVSVSWTAR